jgi:CelD/BcsL family acetyltransferase involved in cellulose biosynthesis
MALERGSVSTVITENAQSTVHTIRPLNHDGWDEFVRSCQLSSIFHTRGWLEALCRTYQYEPVAFTTSTAESAIRNAVLFCFISSRLTGKRLVSLPFSDHCDPLVTDTTEVQTLLATLEQELIRQKLHYIEIRPKRPLDVQINVLSSGYSYCLHQLDLRPNLDTLFDKLHKDSTQRKIRRAEREGVRHEEGRSNSHLETFYRLLLLTRRRHQVPPQPKRWFENLADCMGDSLKIRIAFKGKEPAAAILTLQHKSTLVYKYACSDARLHSSGAMQSLIWKAIEEAKEGGLTALDFGRSAWNNPGLITFKDRWGCTRSLLAYSRYGIHRRRFEYSPDGGWMERAAKRAIAHLPDHLFRALGEILYKQIG